MEQRPVIYCKVANDNIQAKILGANKDLDFWSLSFDENKAFDISLQFLDNEVIAHGIKEAIPLEHNIAHILNLISPLDLSYINELCSNEPDEIKEMLELFKSELKLNLEPLQKAFKEKDAEQIKFYAHKLVSKIVVLSIPVYDDCKFVENNATDWNNPLFISAYYKVITHCFITLWQVSA